jgi:mRNA interferase MazF
MKDGKLFIANLNPTKGHEQAGIRPVVVISVEGFNDSFLDLVMICPLTTQEKQFLTHIEVNNDNLKKRSFVKCEDLRSISKERLIKEIGFLSKDDVYKIKEIIRKIIGY